jgi:hypothetical protein
MEFGPLLVCNHQPNTRATAENELRKGSDRYATISAFHAECYTSVASGAVSGPEVF